jgi:hypothetical protein
MLSLLTGIRKATGVPEPESRPRFLARLDDTTAPALPWLGVAFVL